jgi:hypothetical protein
MPRLKSADFDPTHTIWVNHLIEFRIKLRLCAGPASFSDDWVVEHLQDGLTATQIVARAVRTLHDRELPLTRKGYALLAAQAGAEGDSIAGLIAVLS